MTDVLHKFIGLSVFGSRSQSVSQSLIATSHFHFSAQCHLLTLSHTLSHSLTPRCATRSTFPFSFPFFGAACRLLIGACNLMV